MRASNLKDRYQRRSLRCSKIQTNARVLHILDLTFVGLLFILYKLSNAEEYNKNRYFIMNSKRTPNNYKSLFLLYTTECFLLLFLTQSTFSFSFNFKHTQFVALGRAIVAIGTASDPKIPRQLSATYPSKVKIVRY